MKLEVLVHSKVRQKVPVMFAKKVLKKAIHFFQCTSEADVEVPASLVRGRPESAIVSMIFVGDQKIRKLNRIYRGKDKVTNVLSFSPNQEKVNGQWPMANSQDLGDIFICFPEAVREAKKYNLTLKQEIARLLVHGFLHLLGYKHGRRMERLERKILSTKSLRARPFESEA